MKIPSVVSFSCLALLAVAVPAAATDPACQDACLQDRRSCMTTSCGVMLVCDECEEQYQWCLDGCEPTSPPPPPACTRDVCTGCARPAAGIDADVDGVPDDFEHDLAYWFFPAVRLQYFDHDLSQSYYYANPGVPYTVRPVRFSVCDEDKECMEIRYALAYRRDFGDSIFGTSHLGDSEFYAAIVQRTAPWSTAAGSMSSWQMIRDFTSAHWGENIFDFSVVGAYGYCATSCSMWDNDGQSCNANPQCDFFPGLCSGTSSQIGTTCSMINNEGECFFAGCSWQDSDCYSATTCYSTVPLAGHRNVYAATRKHSNYHSDAACDAGAYGRDECQTNQYNLRNAVAGKLQNVGSSTAHAGLDVVIQHPDDCNLYQVWGTAGFANSPPYRQHFLAPINWALP